MLSPEERAALRRAAVEATAYNAAHPKAILALLDALEAAEADQKLAPRVTVSEHREHEDNSGALLWTDLYVHRPGLSVLVAVHADLTSVSYSVVHNGETAASGEIKSATNDLQAKLEAAERERDNDTIELVRQVTNERKRAEATEAKVAALEAELDHERKTSLNDPCEQRAERYALEVAVLEAKLAAAEAKVAALEQERSAWRDLASWQSGGTL